MVFAAGGLGTPCTDYMEHRRLSVPALTRLAWLPRKGIGEKMTTSDVLVETWPNYGGASFVRPLFHAWPYGETGYAFLPVSLSRHG